MGKFPTRTGGTCTHGLAADFSGETRGENGRPVERWPESGASGTVYDWVPDGKRKRREHRVCLAWLRAAPIDERASVVIDCDGILSANLRSEIAIIPKVWLGELAACGIGRPIRGAQVGAQVQQLRGELGALVARRRKRRRKRRRWLREGAKSIVLRCFEWGALERVGWVES